MAKLTSTQERELRTAFDLLDRDHSGKISKTELKDALSSLNIKAIDHEVQRLLELMDTDKSGDIDYNEFKKVMAKSFTKKYSRKELHNAFKQFDKDGNGFITESELRSVMLRFGKHMSHTELQAMIRSVDLNKDGKISLDEFCTLFD